MSTLQERLRLDDGPGRGPLMYRCRNGHNVGYNQPIPDADEYDEWPNPCPVPGCDARLWWDPQVAWSDVTPTLMRVADALDAAEAKLAAIDRYVVQLRQEGGPVCDTIARHLTELLRPEGGTDE